VESLVDSYVIWNLNSHSKEELFEEVAKFLEENHLISERQDLFRELNQRENLGSTMIDDLIAAPHAQSNIFAKNVVIFVSLEEAVELWDGSSAAQYFVFCCLREDITLPAAKQISKILKSFVKDEVKKSLYLGNRELIEKIISG
jgi:mannitol/fructose-specific phosphotransferase system IIA component (Ntr-type)